MSVEKECLEIEMKWKEHSELLEKEIEKWKKSYELEKTKTEKLREHLSRTERELYGILQRKYELIRGPATNKKGITKTDDNNSTSPNALKRNDNSWNDNNNDNVNSKSNTKESKKAREKKVLAELSDFLGF